MILIFDWPSGDFRTIASTAFGSMSPNTAITFLRGRISSAYHFRTCSIENDATPSDVPVLMNCYGEFIGP